MYLGVSVPGGRKLDERVLLKNIAFAHAFVRIYLDFR